MYLFILLKKHIIYIIIYILLYLYIYIHIIKKYYYNIYIYASLTRTLLSQSTHIRYIWAQAPLLPETNRKGAAIATCMVAEPCSVP